MEDKDLWNYSVLLTDRKWTIPLSYTFSSSNAWAIIFFAALEVYGPAPDV
jgi:hypothetical protein